MDILTAILGVLLGIFTGITPGIHVNTAIALLVAGRQINKELTILIISATIAHTFADAIPATFLGIPDVSFAVSAYPAHEMCLEGRGIEAVTISAFSGIIAVVLTLPLFFLMLKYLRGGYTESLVLPVLVLTSIFIVFREKGDIFGGRHSRVLNCIKALTVFTLSGILGTLVFKLNAKNLLLPLFSGLFAFPILYRGARGTKNLPGQEVGVKLKPLSALTGTLSGSLVSLFPGISSGVASALAVSPFKESEADNYVSATGAANTSNALLCFAVLMSTGKSRSGAALALRTIYRILNPADILLLCVFSALLSAILTILLGIFTERVLRRLNLRILCSVSLIFLTLAVLYLTKVTGLLLFALSIPVGLLPEILEVKRLNCMGCLLLPLTLSRLGLTGF